MGVAFVQPLGPGFAVRGFFEAGAVLSRSSEFRREGWRCWSAAHFGAGRRPGAGEGESPYDSPTTPRRGDWSEPQWPLPIST